MRTGEWRTLRLGIGDLGSGEPQEWGPWEWRTPGMADPGNGGPEPPTDCTELVDLTLLLAILRFIAIF